MVIDTSIFIEFLRKKDKTQTSFFKINDSDNLNLSVITLYELLMGATNEQKLKDIKILIQNIKILPFDEEVAYQANSIYQSLKKKNKIIEFRDIFIAATCLVNNQKILTLNKKHFSRIDNLHFVEL